VWLVNDPTINCMTMGAMDTYSQRPSKGEATGVSEKVKSPTFIIKGRPILLKGG